MCDESLQEEVVARFDVGDERLRLYGQQLLEKDLHQDLMEPLIEDLPIMQPVEKHESEQVAHQQVLDCRCRSFRL